MSNANEDGRVTSRSKVIGVGNPWRRDDAAGLAAARRVRDMSGLDVEVEELEGDLTSLIDAWDGSEHVVVIDAVCSGAEPGTVHRLDARTTSIPPDLDRHSTHAVGLATAIELGRALDRLPPRLTVFGIEGQCFDAGTGLTPRVEDGIARTVTAVVDELRARTGTPTAPS
jgi:hydrogenase maturation protease